MRAQWAKDVLACYAVAHRTEIDQQTLSDLLNNLLHLAARQKDIDFVAALTLAKMHFRDEYLEELADTTADGL
jgi:hypothetical protein